VDSQQNQAAYNALAQLSGMQQYQSQSALQNALALQQAGAQAANAYAFGNVLGAATGVFQPCIDVKPCEPEAEKITIRSILPKWRFDAPFRRDRLPKLNGVIVVLLALSAIAVGFWLVMH